MKNRSKIKVGLLAALLSAAIAAPVYATQLDDGIAAVVHGDYETALTLLRPLAEQGEPRAQFNLAYMYEAGQGVPQDYAQALNWYRKAADHGMAMAQSNLGTMYSKGEGVQQDNVEALKWHFLAAASFPPAQSKYRDQEIRNRDALAAKMSPAQIAAAQKLAMEWKPQNS